jgi:type IV pilus assembly protein PilM
MTQQGGLAMLQTLLDNLMPGKSAMGMEITDEQVKLCEVELDSGKKIRVIGYAGGHLPEGTVMDGRVKQPAVLEQAIRDLLELNNWSTKRVHLAIPTQTVLVKTIKLPDVPDKQLDKLIRYELGHNVSLPFEHPYYDYTRIRSIPTAASTAAAEFALAAELAAGTTANWRTGLARLGLGRKPFAAAPLMAAAAEPTETPLCEVLLVAAPMEILQEYAGLFERLKLRAASFEIKPFALLRLQEKIVGGEADSLIFLDVNRTNSEMTIVEDGVFRITRNVEIPFAESPLSPASGHTVADNDAAMATLDEERLFENACQDLLAEYERLLNFYRYTLGNRDRDFPAIVLSGSLQQMDKLQDYLAARLTQKIITFGGSERLKRRSATIDISAYAVPIGLALRGKH